LTLAGCQPVESLTNFGLRVGRAVHNDFQMSDQIER
jgi:hypothetical protein